MTMTMTKKLLVGWCVLLAAGCDPRCTEPPPPPDAGPPPGAVLHVLKSGDGNGSIESDPEGVDCGTDCPDQLVSYTVETTTVTLIAEAARDALFENWTCTSTKNGEPQPQVVLSDLEIVAFDDPDPDGLEVECTARFRQLHTLLVIFAGEGTGRVTGSAPAPEGGLRIDCPPKCTAGYFAGETETLTPTADPGSAFTGWAICADGTGDATVVLDDDINCEARFE